LKGKFSITTSVFFVIPQSENSVKSSIFEKIHAFFNVTVEREENKDQIHRKLLAVFHELEKNI
jgi:hypothetical protein